MTTVATILTSMGGSAVIIAGVLKIFGNKIVNNLFEKRIETFKYRINLEFDRVSKINQKEFEVLPTLWDKLIEHKKRFEEFTMDFVIDVDLNQLTEAELKDYVSKIPFDASIKNMILVANDKNKKNREIYLYQGIFILQESYSDYSFYYQRSKLFMTDEIAAKGLELDEFLKSTLTVYNLFLGPYEKNIRDIARNDFQATFNRKASELGELIRKRLKFPDQ